MKKPDIDMQSKRMMVDTKTYSEMIDALIEIYECYLRGETIPFNPEIIEKALIKAGVEL